MKIKNAKRTIALIILLMIFMMLFSPFFPFLSKAQVTADPVLPDFKAPTTDPVLPDYKAPTPDPVLPDYKAPTADPASPDYQTPENGSTKPDAGNQRHPWLDTEDAGWKITKFISKDIALDWTGAIEPFTGNNPIDDINVAGKSAYNILKSPRGIIGAFYGDGTPPKIIVDAWDAADKTVDSINIVRDVKKVKQLEEIYRAGSALERANAQTALNSMRTVSRLSKGVAIGGMFVSGVDMVFKITDAIQADNGGERADKIVGAVGSLGEGLVSASVLAGPTPLGAGLLIGGAILWGASALYGHIGGSKTVVKAAKAVASGAKKVWNKVTSWF